MADKNTEFNLGQEYNLKANIHDDRNEVILKAVYAGKTEFLGQEHHIFALESTDERYVVESVSIPSRGSYEEHGLIQNSWQPAKRLHHTYRAHIDDPVIESRRETLLGLLNDRNQQKGVVSA